MTPSGHVDYSTAFGIGSFAFRHCKEGETLDRRRLCPIGKRYRPGARWWRWEGAQGGRKEAEQSDEAPICLPCIYAFMKVMLCFSLSLSSTTGSLVQGEHR